MQSLISSAGTAAKCLTLEKKKKISETSSLQNFQLENHFSVGQAVYLR